MCPAGVVTVAGYITMVTKEIAEKLFVVGGDKWLTLRRGDLK